MINESLLQQFLEYSQLVRGCRPKTVQAYFIDLKIWNAFCSLHNLQDPNPSKVKFIVDYILYLRTQRNNAAAAVSRKLASISAFIDFLILMELLDFQLDERKKWPKLLDIPERLPIVLTFDEMQALLSQPDTSTILGRRDFTILALIYSSGLRVSEVCTLQLQDISFSEKRIHVSGKGGKDRFVPLDPIVEESLQKYLDSRTNQIPQLFVSKKGGALTPRAIQFMVKKYAVAAKIDKNVTPHKLRHTCATHLLQEGAKEVSIQKLLGHKSLSTTQIYLHITITDLKVLCQQHPMRKMRTTLGLPALIPSSFQSPYGSRTGT